MPIYEYRCKTCGFEFEKIMRMLADNPQCPECGEDVDKLLSLSDFKIKGQPPKNWRPRKKSTPKSHIPNMKYARKKQ